MRSVPWLTKKIEVTKERIQGRLFHDGESSLWD